jgi:hypothetical protein
MHHETITQLSLVLGYYSWLLHVFWGDLQQEQIYKYNVQQLGFGVDSGWLGGIIGLAIMQPVWAWCNKATSMFDL